MKFSLGQKVWVMKDNKPVELEIKAILLKDFFSGKKAEVRYSFVLYETNDGYKIDDKDTFPESQVFETKQDLINSL